jgi:hypothetical protein
MVPLSEEELRLLEQMERALVAEDPKLASTLRGTTLRASARRRALVAGVVFLVGVAVMMVGAVSHAYVVAVVGFVVMVASAYVALSSWRGQSQAPQQQSGSSPVARQQGLSVVEGGRSRKRGPRRPRGASGPRRSSGSGGSMMQRFEERWRRRRDQNGY